MINKKTFVVCIANFINYYAEKPKHRCNKKVENLYLLPAYPACLHALFQNIIIPVKVLHYFIFYEPLFPVCRTSGGVSTPYLQATLSQLNSRSKCLKVKLTIKFS